MKYIFVTGMGRSGTKFLGSFLGISTFTVLTSILVTENIG